MKEGSQGGSMGICHIDLCEQRSLTNEIAGNSVVLKSH